MAIGLHGNNQEPMSEINVTPFVDVMLVLLIIFMVAAPLVEQGVEVDLPETQSRKSVSVKETDVVLTIDKKEQIFLAKQQIDVKELSPKLKAIFENKRDKEIYLKADKAIPYGFVVKVMALIKNAGIDKMAMVTDTEP